jgi:hypothetical protein
MGEGRGVIHRHRFTRAALTKVFLQLRKTCWRAVSSSGGGTGALVLMVADGVCGDEMRSSL